MSTVIRPEISDKKKYWISKERYYELKHFCLQYPEWRKLYSELSEASFPLAFSDVRYDSTLTDSTGDKASEMFSLRRKMSLIEDAAVRADNTLCRYIFKAVTENLSYVYMDTIMHIPCGKDMFYDRYRKFFWLLSSERD